MTNDITYTPVTAWGSAGWVETGDLNASYTNAHGATLGGYIWLGIDEATVGVVGVSSKAIRYGARAAADGAINNPAYRAKIIGTARAELERQFRATDAGGGAGMRYTATIRGHGWSRPPVAGFATIRAARAWAEEHGRTADGCEITDAAGRVVARHERDQGGNGTQWYRAAI